MKRLTTILLAFLLTLTTWLGTEAEAQNAVFEKYAEMENIEYVCITSAMLRNLGKNSATINGIHIDGITDALKNVLILNTTDPKAAKAMKDDYMTLRQNKDYELMMDMRDGSDRVVTLAKVAKEGSELVLFITEGRNETSFVVLSGNFTQKQLNKLLSGATASASN